MKCPKCGNKSKAAGGDQFYYYSDERCTIYHGDCRALLRTLIVSGVGLVVADPPYGMGKTEWDKLIPWGEWLPICTGACVTTAVFCGVRGTHDYPKADWIGAWVRPASTQRNGKLRGFNNWEPILLYGLNRLANDVWTYQNRQDKEAARHPTSKPVRLLRDMIGRLGGEDGAILDPFMGSGTTLVAAKLEGRKAVGIEIEERYCEIAANRLRQGTLF